MLLLLLLLVVPLLLIVFSTQTITVCQSVAGRERERERDAVQRDCMSHSSQSRDLKERQQLRGRDAHRERETQLMDA